MNQTDLTFPLQAKHRGERKLPRIAIINSCWHEDIVSNGLNAMRAEFERGGISSGELKHFRVPGAFEIPLHAKRLAVSRKFDAIIACGFVVNGGIYRHEFVAAAVIDGLMRVQLDTDVPIFSAVLTPRDFHDHEEHQRFFHAHFEKKGVEVARACMATLESLSALPA